MATAAPAAGAPRTRVPTLLREPVYMLDLATYKPPDELKIDLAACSDAAWAWKFPDGRPVDKATHEFVRDVFSKSGIDTKGSYLPKNLHPVHTSDPRGGCHESFAEARMIMGGVVTELLEKTGLKPSDVDILVTSSSIFCPTPSLSSMLINMLKLREDVMAFR
jgi:3-ketoacyl-CoA synthase